MNMTNIWLSKVQKIFKIHRLIRPLSTQNKTLWAMIARRRLSLKAVTIAESDCPIFGSLIYLNIWLVDGKYPDFS